MVRQYQRKNEALDPKNLWVALNMVKSGSSVRTVAKFYGINHETLRRYWKARKGDLDEAKVTDPAKSGRPTVFSEEQEEALKKYLLSCIDCNIDITVKDIRTMAFDYAQELGVSTPSWNDRKMAGIEWFYGFRKRHPDFLAAEQGAAKKNKNSLVAVQEAPKKHKKSEIEARKVGPKKKELPAKTTHKIFLKIS